MSRLKTRPSSRSLTPSIREARYAFEFARSVGAHQQFVAVVGAASRLFLPAGFRLDDSAAHLALHLVRGFQQPAGAWHHAGGLRDLLPAVHSGEPVDVLADKLDGGRPHSQRRYEYPAAQPVTAAHSRALSRDSRESGVYAVCGSGGGCTGVGLPSRAAPLAGAMPVVCSSLAAGVAAALFLGLLAGPAGLLGDTSGRAAGGAGCSDLPAGRAGCPGCAFARHPAIARYRAAVPLHDRLSHRTATRAAKSRSDAYRFRVSDSVVRRRSWPVSAYLACRRAPLHSDRRIVSCIICNSYGASCASPFRRRWPIGQIF